jgi:putative phosphoesterase
VPTARDRESWREVIDMPEAGPRSVLAIISDTHLPRGHRRLPDACVQRLRAADLILHAGDLVSVGFLDELTALGPPVHAVAGNVDEAAVAHRLPQRTVIEAGGVRIGMVHDAGPARGRLARQRANFPDCDAVVFGHSHIPLHEVTDDGAFQLFNPGSPTDRRRQPVHTMGEGVVDAGRLTLSLVDLG